MAAELHRSRASYAYLQVEGWRALGPHERDTLTSWLPGLPVLIRSQGLLVALCMLKKDSAHKLASALEDWLLGTPDGAPRLFATQPRGGVIRACAETTRPTYQAAQREALALAEMFKLMADAHGFKRRA